MSITVFYAWQSDRPQDTCRFLIRDAAKLAVKKLNADAAVREAPPFALDHDTKGVTGHQHIASVIRRKIKACGVFLADLTHVASYVTADGRKKQAQNPNVLIELGIAAKAKGYGRLILVMNDHYGPPNELQFDLQSHSHPITYTLADDADKAAIKAATVALADRIAASLKPMLDKIKAKQDVARREAEAAVIAAGRERAEGKRRSFESQIREGKYRNLDISRVVLALTIVPLTLDAGPLNISDIQKKRWKELPPMSDPDFERDHEFTTFAKSFACHDADRYLTTRTESVVELDEDGVLLVAYRITHTRMERTPKGVWFAKHEQNLVQYLSLYVRFLRSVGVSGPLQVAVSLLGVSGLTLIPPKYDPDSRVALRTLDADLSGDPMILASDSEVDPKSLAVVVRRNLLPFWRAAGLTDDPAITEDGLPVNLRPTM